MPRTARSAPGKVIFHCLNRGNNGAKLFFHAEDYAAFETALEEVLETVPARLLGYCLMPDHWHLLLWPRKDGQLGQFMQRLTVRHVRRWHAHRGSTGQGHVYQGIYKSFPVQDNRPFLNVARYIESNPLRVGLVTRAENWKWCSLWRRERGTPEQRGILAEWPVQRPRDWMARMNRPQNQAEEDAVRTSLIRGRPYGDELWQQRTARRLNLGQTFRDRGRPSKTDVAPELKRGKMRHVVRDTPQGDRPARLLMCAALIAHSHSIARHQSELRR